MMRAITALAQNVTALAHAPKGEDYSGPVLFEGGAGAQLLAEVLGKNLALARRPVSDGGRGGGFAPNELEGRLGARVLPESFNVVDDPTQKEWRGRPLFGYYEVDREGVVPHPLKIVEAKELRRSGGDERRERGCRDATERGERLDIVGMVAKFVVAY